MRIMKKILAPKILFTILRLPLLYALLGLSFFALDYLNNFIPVHSWKPFFNYTGKIGKIFLAIAALTLIYRIFVVMLKRIERKLYARYRISSLILTNLRKSLFIILIFLAINIIIVLLQPTPFYLMLTNNIMRSLVIIAVGMIAIQAVNILEEVVIQRLHGTAREHRRAKAIYTKARILRNIATVLIILITIGVLLMSFHSVRNLGISLLASAGFLTAIIGLAAQKPLASLFSGLQIALSQRIKIGDIVVVQGQSGVIEELTFTYVVIKIGDKRRLIVPINTFIDTSFENWSHEMDGLQNSVYLNIDYLIPIDVLRQHLTNILKTSSYWNGVTNSLHISNLGEQSVQVRIQVSASHPNNLWNLMTEVQEKMLLFLQTNYPDSLPRLQINFKRDGIEKG